MSLIKYPCQIITHLEKHGISQSVHTVHAYIFKARRISPELTVCQTHNLPMQSPKRSSMPRSYTRNIRSNNTMSITKPPIYQCHRLTTSTGSAAWQHLTGRWTSYWRRQSLWPCCPLQIESAKRNRTQRTPSVHLCHVQSACPSWTKL